MRDHDPYDVRRLLIALLIVIMLVVALLVLA
jgi:hypothetical protein